MPKCFRAPRRAQRGIDPRPEIYTRASMSTGRYEEAVIFIPVE